jgi:hypothetical protein
MKPIAFVIAALLAAAAPSSAQLPTRDQPATPATAAAPRTGTASLAGRVVTADQNAAPMRRAIVTLSSAELGYAQTVVTDDEGRFEFPRLPAGRFALSAIKPGYLTTTYGAAQPGRSGTLMMVAAGQSIASVVLRMSRGAAIAGVVRDQNGEPVPGVQVGLVRAGVTATNGPVAAGLAPASETMTTDDRGSYRAFGLAPGTYFVVAGLRSFAASETELRSNAEVDAILQELQRGAGRVTPGGGLADAAAPPVARAAPASPPRASFVTFAPSYHPGTAVRADAAPVVITAGDERTGIDIVLRPVPTAAVEGVVFNPNGPLPALQMSLNMDIAATAGLGNITPSAPTLLVRPGPEGKFKFVGVVPGRYTLLARSTATGGGIRFQVGGAVRGGGPGPDMPASPVLWAMAEVTINGEDVSGLTLTLEPALQLSGRVIFDAPSMTPPPDATKVRVSLSSPATTGATVLNGQLIGQMPIPSVAARADGAFAVVGITPGNYQVNATSPGPGLWLRSAMLGGTDLLDTPLAVTGGMDLGSVILTFTERRTELSGTLQSTTGQPAPDYFVVVFSTDRAHWRPRARRLVSARPATDGRFVIRDLPPGEYFLAALTDVDPDEWQAPAFLEQVVAGAIRITVGEGEKKVQNIGIAR